jgi:AAA domain-containing protein
MGLRIRQLLMAITTAQGKYGATLRFQDGLNVLWAPNTSGKSTAMMSILYALGLEGMLGPSQQPPLPDAMRNHIMTADGDEIGVVESFVRLEIENHSGERIAIQRHVESSENVSRQLIRGVMGPALTEPGGKYKRRDFYVRTGGAAQEESGFHRFLAEFVGLDLPQIPTADNETVPLYLECLFPFFFVDQMSGWRDIKARMPTYLRIPEMQKRSSEFVLDLDILRKAIDKQNLERRQITIRDKWSDTFRQAKAEAAAYHVVIRGVPEAPVATWPPTPEPELLVTDGAHWEPVDDSLAAIEARLQEIEENEIPRAEQVAQGAVEELQEAEMQLDRLTGRLETLARDLNSERAHRDSIFTRLQALAEDYRKYQDAKKLEDRGGTVSLKTASGHCPTCHQEIKDVLLEQEHAAPPMTLEENMVFIRDQIATFRDMHEDAAGVVEAKERQVAATRGRIEDVNGQVRAIKHTLRSGGRAPSAAAIQEKLQAEQTAVSLQTLKGKFAEFETKFDELAAEWTEVQAGLKSLANMGLSDMDEKKLEYLETQFVEQLEAYDFRSFPIEQIGISRESYRAARDGYDVGLTSASDTIRMIWSYLLGMLETDRKFNTHHLGLLIFDEPRQQGMKKESFDAFLNRAAKSTETKQQVIVATSEDRETLDHILVDVLCNYMKYDEKILKRIIPKSSSK